MPNRPFSVLWLQAGSCGGCTMAMLDAEGVGLVDVLDAVGGRFLWHPSVSGETGRAALDIIAAAAEGRTPLDILCIEGSLLTGPLGSGRFHMMSGSDRPVIDWVRQLAGRAGAVVAVGSCAAFGGIPAGGSNPTEAVGLQFDGEDADGGLLGADFRSLDGLPVINVAGCAPHPGWIAETLIALGTGRLGPEDLDPLGRPRFFADHLAHHGCSRNEYYEFKASAGHLGQQGCLMEHLGCRATQAVGDCNKRTWNGGGGCTSAGSTCIACTSPAFERLRSAFAETPKVAGIPVGLPVDMPRAWFVALATLSKSATPERVRTNATADHVAIPPRRGKRGEDG